jgi:glc operon protein GlcG
MTIQEVPMYHSLSLGHAEAQLAIQSIQAELLQRGKTAAIAVADAHGELIGLLRMDGAPLPSILIASNKAWTAARERKASWELGQAARDSQTGFDIAYFGDSRYAGWGGGLPVYVEGAVVGAVAVSGLAEGEDIELAEIGVAVITTLRASPQNTSTF